MFVDTIQPHTPPHYTCPTFDLFWLNCIIFLWKMQKCTSINIVIKALAASSTLIFYSHRWDINAAFYAAAIVNQNAACVARKMKLIRDLLKRFCELEFDKHGLAPINCKNHRDCSVKLPSDVSQRQDAS